MRLDINYGFCDYFCGYFGDRTAQKVIDQKVVDQKVLDRQAKSGCDRSHFWPVRLSPLKSILALKSVLAVI